MTFDPTTAYIGEVPRWPQEVIKYQGFRADRRVRVNWDDRYNWANFFLFSYPAECIYPYFAVNGYTANCAIMSLAITPDINTRLSYGTYSVSQAEYGAAFIDIRYETAGFDLTNVFMEEFSPNNEQHHWGPPVYLYWSDGSNWGSNSDPATSCSSPLVIDCPSYTYTKTYYRENLPSSWYLLGGTTNMIPFSCSLLPIVIDTNCGLAEPGEIKAVLGFNGQLVYSEKKFVKVRGHDWNMEWDPIRGVWDYLYTNSGWNPDGSPILNARIYKYGQSIFQFFL